jgi:hypothetical protein
MAVSGPEAAWLLINLGTPQADKMVLIFTSI